MSDRKDCRKDYGNSEVKTSLLIQTYAFSWRFENFQDWPDCFEVTSDKFQPIKDLVFHATFERYKSKSVGCEIKLKFISKGNNSYEIKNQLTILDSTGNVFFDGKPNALKKDQNGMHELMINSERIKEYNESTKDQIVILKCSLEFSRLTTETVNRQLLKSSTDLLPTLVEDFKAMYVDSLCTDFSLQSENSVLRVHKFVLCARSPVLAKMLKSPMDEKIKDAVEIADIDLSTLKAFVEFLYTGDTPTDVDFDFWCSLYYAADKYDVTSLRKTCAGTLLDKLDAEKSCRALSLANRHSDVQLLGFVLDFMERNFDAVMETEAWYELVVSEPELVNQVMRLRVQSKKACQIDGIDLKQNTS